MNSSSTQQVRVEGDGSCRAACNGAVQLYCASVHVMGLHSCCMQFLKGKKIAMKLSQSWKMLQNATNATKCFFFGGC